MRSKGFTLIELMAAISVCAIVLFVGIPALGTLIEKEKAGVSSRTVQHALATARQAAVFANSSVSICTSMDGVSCEKKWGSHLIVFHDPLANGKVEDAAQVRHVLPLESGWRVRWSAFGNKPHLTLTGQGYTQHQNGSFYLCPAEDKGLGRRIAVNKAGRGRLAADENGNGYSQKTDGSDMTCELPINK